MTRSSASASASTIYGISTKYVSLVVLIVQNSALVLIMRHSRTLPGPRYLSSTAVVLSEILKCTVCLAIHLYKQCHRARYLELPLLSEDAASSRYGVRQPCAEVFSPKSGFFKLLVPAVFYTLQNNLQFIAASNLDAATFQVTYQCKILSAALFAVLLLRQSLPGIKWISLLVLTLGVACVQIPSGTPAMHAEGNYFTGLIAVAVACLCSGFAGVYFEKMLKNSNNTSLLLRNIQLSIGCLSIALGGTCAWDGRAIANNGFFYGYNSITVLTICIQAAGGLIVALVIKYADNILKGFATSLSTILSTVASMFLFDFIVTVNFLIGSALVFFATYLYSMPEEVGAVEPMDEGSRQAKPMLEVDAYDEKMEGALSFRDEIYDVEAGSTRRDAERSSSPERSGKGAGEGRNSTPSLLQRGQERKGVVLHELGHVH